MLQTYSINPINFVQIYFSQQLKSPFKSTFINQKYSQNIHKISTKVVQHFHPLSVLQSQLGKFSIVEWQAKVQNKLFDGNRTTEKVSANI